MAKKVLFPEWRDETKQLRYPFADSAALTNGVLEIPNWLFLDGRLYPIGGGTRFYISKIVKAADVVTFTLSDETAELATASYDISAVPANGELVFVDSYGRPAGMLLSASQYLSIFGAMGQGTYAFDIDDTEFAAIVATPQPDAGVRGVVTDDGDVLTGEVWLVGENGVVLREEDGAVRVDIVGDPFADRALCEAEEPQDDPEEGGGEAVLDPYCPVMTINKYAPDRYGNFEMRVGSNESLTNLMRITPGTGNVLRVELLGERRFRGAE
jgi:hypothetical protein